MADMLWSVDTEKKQLFLTFDDGPTPVITEWVLKVLADFNAKATFFCLGKNVELHSEIYQKILSNGHSVGNHTYNHPNGWKTEDEVYFDNVSKCSKFINSKLFRPPYGKISRSQNIVLKKNYTVVMWDVLSGDFDLSITPEKCLDNVVSNATKGSIIVMHDSIKAEKNLRYVLPKALEYFTEKGFSFEKLL
ncbi:MAG: polysaccharide deacetylase family protein [Flavobacteriales bacterium]|nr:polysaccharide deacetylase family protein [Flavobacteriales bacterium]